MIKIQQNIELIDPYPAIYIKRIDALVITDLHLGIESILAEQGVYVPKVQFKKEISILKKIFEIESPSKIIIIGDIKHEFSETSYHEFIEVHKLLSFLTEQTEVLLIKGNHDNYINRVTKSFNIPVTDIYEEKEYFFAHGHEDIALEKVKSRTIIIGHEHPAIALYDNLGIKEKLPVLMVGKLMTGHNIVVLPAFSTFAQGSEVNNIPQSELLSPMLRNFANIDDFCVWTVDVEVGVFEYPELKRLKIRDTKYEI